MRAQQRLVDLDELIDQVIEPLLVIDRGATLVILDLTNAISFEILGEHLSQIFMKLLRVLVL